MPFGAPWPLLAASGPLLGGSWAAPGASWASLGPPLGPSWPLLGFAEGLLGLPWRALERSWRLVWRVRPKTRKSSTVQRFSWFFGPQGALLGPPGSLWAPLGAAQWPRKWPCRPEWLRKWPLERPSGAGSGSRPGPKGGARVAALTKPPRPRTCSLYRLRSEAWRRCKLAGRGFGGEFNDFGWFWGGVGGF